MTKNLICILLVLNWFLAACNNSGGTEKKGDSYEERINNIFALLEKYPNSYDGESTNIYLLQVKKCNVCDSTSLSHIEESLKNCKNKVVIIMSDFDKNIRDTVYAHFGKRSYKIFTDSLNLIPRYGLLFMQNAEIVVKKKDVVKYDFL